MATKLTERNKIAADLADIRDNPDGADETHVAALRAQKDTLDADLNDLEARAADLVKEQAADDAADRLARHMSEEQVERGQYLERAAGTGAFAGLTVPQYLTDLYAPATAALRPFADICNRHELPAQGMTVNISRITTATSVALQASENAAVSETNIDDSL